MLIRDLVTQNPRAAFANDVQLSWYPDDPRNLEMVEAYMFADKAPEGKVSSCELLEKISRSFLWSNERREENRHVLIATYGRGKTHLALCLTNLFGRAANSPEVAAVLASFAHAADAARTQNLRDFKEGRPAQLVIRLRGDQPQGLHQQFMVGLEKALREHPGGLEAEFPFWYKPAERFLEALSGEPRVKADGFLAGYQLDVNLLIEKVRSKAADAHDLCVGTHQAAYGTLPNFGGEISLQEVVTWAAKTYCAGDQPKAGGILILFDEFSAFVKRYARSREVSSSSALQDLLNGVRDHPRQVVFLALTQVDPSTVAKQLHRHSSTGELDDLEKELSRLPASHRYTFHSSMETVLAAYLRQESAPLDELFDRATVAVEDASDDTLQLFSPRYDVTAGWGQAKFMEVVTRGCYPLHPLTTALFCSTEFAETESERTVLNFVLTELQRKLDEPAIVGSRPNWIYATRLVDWFGEMLGGAADASGATLFTEYQHARTRLGGDITPLQDALLKAVLLFHISHLKLGGLRFEQVMAHLSGFPHSECREAIEELTANGYLRYDATRRAYAFWAAGAGAGWHVEDFLKRELPKYSLEWDVLSKFNQADERLRSLEVDLERMANAQDWAAPERLLTREFFTIEHLRQMALGYRIHPKNGFQDGVRGCVVRLVADNEADVEFFYNNAESILAEALGPDPIPLVVAVPRQPTPQLRVGILREKILRELDNTQKSTLGIEACSSVLNRTIQSVKEELGKLRSSTFCVVPVPYRAAVAQRGAQDEVLQALKVCYSHAYHRNPNRFLTQYSMAKRNLASAVFSVCKALAANRVPANNEQLQGNAISRELLAQVLEEGKQGSWGVLTVARQIQPPTSARVKLAWDHLEHAFAPGCTSVAVADVLLPLLNPPYGYDYNQLALLFCAWCGFHGHELHFREGSASVSISDYFTSPDVPRNVISRICHLDQVRISRVDQMRAEDEIRVLIEMVRKERFSLDIARETAKRLADYAQEERNNPVLRQGADNAVRTLQEAAAIAKAFESGVDEITAVIASSPTLEKLLPLYGQIERLPKLERVSEAAWPTASDLSNQVDTAVTNALEGACARLETLTQLADFTHREQQLTNLEGRLIRQGITTGRLRVAEALKRLRAKRGELEAAQRDAEIRSELRAMGVSRNLQDLRNHLARIDGFKPQADVTRSEVDKRRKQVEEAIAGLTRWVEGLSEQIDRVTSAEQAAELAAAILKRHQNVEGTPEQQIVDAALERLRNLEKSFRRLATLQGRVFTSREAADEVLVQLQSEGQSAALYLGERQRPLYEAAVTTVQAQIEAKEQQALNWLGQLEADADKGLAVSKLIGRLGQEQPFLPEAAHERLAQLRRTVAARQAAEQEEEARLRRDAETRAQVEARSEKGNLRDLRRSLEFLGTLQPEAESTRQLLERKRKAITVAVTSAEQLLDELDGRVEAAGSLQHLKQVHAQVQRAHHVYSETPEAVRIEELAARCSQLEAYFGTLSEVSSTELHNPTQATQLQARLSDLEAEAGKVASDVQRQALVSARAELQHRVDKRVEKAQDWLREQEQYLARGTDPSRVVRALEAPSPFLPITEFPRVEALRTRAQEQIDSLRQARERQAQDEALRQAIAGVPGDGPLCVLREQLQWLQGLEAATPETAQVLSRKLDTLRKSVERAKQDHGALIQRLERVRSTGDARKLAADLGAAGERYRDTPEGSTLANAREQCETLEGLLSRIEHVAAEHLTSDDQVETKREQILAIGIDCGTEIAGPVAEARSAALARVNQQVEVLHAHAEAWLLEQEQAAEKSKQLEELDRRLLVPPPFLTPASRERLQVLRMRVRERIDGDAFQAVTSHFRRIHDQQKRAECIAMLQRMAAELDTA